MQSQSDAGDDEQDQGRRNRGGVLAEHPAAVRAGEPTEICGGGFGFPGVIETGCGRGRGNGEAPLFYAAGYPEEQGYSDGSKRKPSHEMSGSAGEQAIENLAERRAAKQGGKHRKSDTGPDRKNFQDSSLDGANPKNLAQSARTRNRPEPGSIAGPGPSSQYLPPDRLRLQRSSYARSALANRRSCCARSIAPARRRSLTALPTQAL